MTKISNFFAHWKEKRWEQARKNRATFDGWEPKTVNWIFGISFPLSFFLPVYLLCTDQTDLLAISFLCFSIIGWPCAMVHERGKYKPIVLWREICGVIGYIYVVFAFSTLLCIMAWGEGRAYEEQNIGFTHNSTLHCERIGTTLKCL